MGVVKIVEMERINELLRRNYNVIRKLHEYIVSNGLVSSGVGDVLDKLLKAVEVRINHGDENIYALYNAVKLLTVYEIVVTVMSEFGERDGLALLDIVLRNIFEIS